jgi:hypothetical protein
LRVPKNKVPRRVAIGARSPSSHMFFVLSLLGFAAGIRLVTTHPETIFMLGPVEVTYAHLCFAAGALCLVRAIWKWVTD